MQLSEARAKEFKNKVWDYYRRSGRKLPWRPPTLKLRKGEQELNPYKILVSEIMLQQTQVARVIPFYRKFLRRFPNVRALARAPIRDVLRVWQGLGYNRRALYVKRACGIIVQKHGGKVPHDVDTLERLPGVGQSTAGAIRAFAFNLPAVFIETNIRRACIHFFFPRQKKVHDKEILELLEKILDNRNPREWYAALMDYGATLRPIRRAQGKQAQGKQANPNRRSMHYKRQAPFRGSARELRGKILSLLLQEKRFTAANLVQQIGISQKRLASVLKSLEKDGFLAIRRGGASFVS